MSRTALPVPILTQVKDTSDKYKMFAAGDHLVIAFSGGKDSILLSLALRELGVPFTAVSIDMGYERGWGGRIARLGDRIGVPIKITNIRREAADSSTPLTLAIGRRVDILDSMGTQAGGSATPCTHCYSAKALALQQAALSVDAETVAFGHHMTDACASMIKEGLMHIDRHDRQHLAFSRRHFQSLVTELADEASTHDPNHPGPLASRIAELVVEGKVDTDEPPRQVLVESSTGVRVVRPLFDVFEQPIMEAVAQLGVSPERSGCGHSAVASLNSPRELVHYQVLRAAPSTFTAWAANLVRQGIDTSGHGLASSRRRRHELLGLGYKADSTGLGKL